MTTLQKVIKYLAIAFAVFLIAAIAFGIINAVAAVSGVVSWYTDRQSDSQEETLARVDATFGPYSEDISTLKMEIGAADIRIVAGDKLYAQTDNPYIKVTEQNGTLTIQETSHIVNLEGSTLILYIPEEMSFERVKITTGAGRFYTQALSCRELDMELGAGKAEFECLTASGEADIEGGAGQIIISSGSLNDLSFDMGVGEGSITAALRGKAEINAGIGNLKLRLTGRQEDYTIRCEQGLGRIEVDGSVIGTDTTIGSGENYLEVEGGIGNVTITFSTAF